MIAQWLSSRGAVDSIDCQERAQVEFRRIFCAMILLTTAFLLCSAFDRNMPRGTSSRAHGSDDIDHIDYTDMNADSVTNALACTEC